MNYLRRAPQTIARACSWGILLFLQGRHFWNSILIGGGIIFFAANTVYAQKAEVSTGSRTFLRQSASSLPEILASDSEYMTKAFFASVPVEARRAATEGNTAFSKGNFQQAMSAYQKVVQLVPNSLVGLINLGVAQYRVGDVVSAEKNLKRALSLRLETGIAWLALGTAYMNQNRLDEALAALAQARLYDSQNPLVHNYLGVVMSRMGWLDAAESELRTAVELDTNYSDAHYNLALTYMDRSPPSVELAKRHYYIAIQQGAIRDPNMEKSFKSIIAP